jgi:hypothetical protein
MRITSNAACLVALGVFGLFCNISAADSGSYGYPIEDPLAATIIGTPEEYQADLGAPKKVKLFKLKVFKDRVTPKYFWYNDKITYGLLQQKQKAPLIFVIAGTGGNYTGPKMTTMSNAFYNAGFHVVMLPSPTYMSFIIAASNSSVPGLLDDDSQDLYNVMKLAWSTQLKSRMEVSEFYVTGYSLGGAQAAYLAHIDEQQKFFNFKKALVINTPVSLFSSVNILDDYLDNNFKTGKEFEAFWRKIWDAVTKRYDESKAGQLELTPHNLFEAYRDQKPKDVDLEGLIGTAFRISAASLMVTADVMSQSGYIVPKGATAKISADVSDYFVVAHRTGFMEYAQELMLPFYQERDPAITFEKLVQRASLYPLENYLRNSKKIGLIHNEDDIILAAGEMDWLKDVFGDRSKIYPHGGHLGNVAYKDNINYMVEFFKQ